MFLFILILIDRHNIKCCCCVCFRNAVRVLLLRLLALCFAFSAFSVLGVLFSLASDILRLLGFAPVNEVKSPRHIPAIGHALIAQ